MKANLELCVPCNGAGPYVVRIPCEIVSLDGCLCTKSGYLSVDPETMTLRLDCMPDREKND